MFFFSVLKVDNLLFVYIKRSFWTHRGCLKLSKIDHYWLPKLLPARICDQDAYLVFKTGPKLLQDEPQDPPEWDPRRFLKHFCGLSRPSGGSDSRYFLMFFLSEFKVDNLLVV